MVPFARPTLAHRLGQDGPRSVPEAAELGGKSPLFGCESKIEWLLTDRNENRDPSGQSQDEMDHYPTTPTTLALTFDTFDKYEIRYGTGSPPKAQHCCK